jgi:hypothetical protein
VRRPSGARGRRDSAVVREFATRIDERVAEMSSAIREGSFPVGRIHQFLIRDPKERVITAPCFDERVLHHAIMNVCEPILDRWLIDDTFACRIGKGREAAIARAQEFSRKYGWFDRWAKEVLRVRGYVRYMDDIVLWHTDRDSLCEVHARCREFVATTLSLAFKPAEVQRTGAGIPFLGCRVFPTHVELSRRSRIRWRRRVKLLARAKRLGLLSELNLQQRLTALSAFAKAGGAKSWRFRNRVLQESVVNDP